MPQHFAGKSSPVVGCLIGLIGLSGSLGLCGGSGVSRAADSSEFPPELVSFRPYAHNPVFAGGPQGAWDERLRERGWILREGDTYRLWYTGYDGRREGLKKLGYAVSNDGLHWTRHPDNPVFADAWVEDMMVVAHRGVYYMFAEGLDDIAHLLTSPDGLRWTRVGPLDLRDTRGAPIAPGPRGTPTAWVENDLWYLFYERGDRGIWLATSRDMRVWRNVQDEPVLERGPARYDRGAVALNQIFRHRGRYYASYHASDSEDRGRLWSSCLAVSDDLLRWRKYPANPVVADNQSSGQYVHDGQGYRLYTMHDRIRVALPRSASPAPESPAQSVASASVPPESSIPANSPAAPKPVATASNVLAQGKISPTAPAQSSKAEPPAAPAGGRPPDSAPLRTGSAAAKRPANDLLAEYFARETALLTGRPLGEIASAAAWNAQRETLRRQLLEMLGLDPLPEKTDLKPVVTGLVEHPELTVEKLHFQSRPGLYVTGNLYLPKQRTGRIPAILYVCGHARVKEGDISYGGKVNYQHHAIWFARNGYACLVIDTLQLGEIEGTHHGTYGVRRGDRWEQSWEWNARGYTPAGVEAWNCVRALDYLQSRAEIDPERLGVTGRSGGGAYSWWITAIDDRIRCAVPVAGITDLPNHVVDGTVEGHCDCMFMVNTYRWDYGAVAALAAPRPLLISNSDKDRIFPLEGVVRIHADTRRIYRLLNAGDRLGLQITEGPHTDTQELRVHAYRWFNRFLRQEDAQVAPDEKLFAKEQLRVFAAAPADQLNTRIDETFVPRAAPAVPPTLEAWRGQRDAWKTALDEKVFRGWPASPEPLDVRLAFQVEREGVSLSAYDFNSQAPFTLRVYFAQRAGLPRDELKLMVLNALDAEGWGKWRRQMQAAFGEEMDSPLPGPPTEADTAEFAALKKMLQANPWAMAYVAPRGVGPTAWDSSERKQTQIRRRFMLLGQTLDSLRVWDVRRAAQTLRAVEGLAKTPLWLQGERTMAGVTLYASLYEPEIARLDLWWTPRSHLEGPDFLNVLRFLDMPQAVAMAAERTNVKLYQADGEGWKYPQEVADKFGWEKRVQVRVLPPKPAAGE